MTDSTQARPTVAVIGGGVSGLTAAYLLSRTQHVTLFEADERVGGHAHTHDVPLSDGTTAAVDSGFIGGTSALSGILDRKDGRRFVFSIIVE